MDEGGLDVVFGTLSHCSREENLTAVSAIGLTRSTSAHPAASLFKKWEYLLSIML